MTITICPSADPESMFDTALDVITKSRAAELIEDHYRHDNRAGGRKPSGIAYTTTAVLVSLLYRSLAGLPYSLRGAMDTIGQFTPAQLTAVGMAEQDCRAIRTGPAVEYLRFHRFWQLRMTPVDPDFDLPARRMTNAEAKARIAARSDDDRHQSQTADERLTTIINRLLAGSIDGPAPADCHGDVVVDETLVDTATPDGSLGTGDERYRSASSLARYWVRDKNGRIREPGTTRSIAKRGFGVAATLVSRVARPDALHAEPALFIGMEVHAPAGADLEALNTGLEHARRNGLDCRRHERTRQPHIVGDVAYNRRRGFTQNMLTRGYSPVVRYPKNWRLQHESVNPPGAPDGQLPGPIQYAGAFFCPAALNRLKGHRIVRTAELLADGQFRAHDDKLRSIYPFLMGYNSRPKVADQRFGRPRLGGTAPGKSMQVRLVCPAALGTVRCPLKPESMDNEQVGLPTAEPTWAAQDKAVCLHSSVTVHLSDDRVRLAQWGLVPGSWEHAVYYEATRSLTEQRFSQLKSPFVGGLADLKTGPRRTPMIKISIAIAAATVNIRAQQVHDPATQRTESIDIRMRQLARELGYPPVRIPPRS
jgi:hypothetical protein